MELGETSDNEEQRIPDIIISRSSIPDAERARNIRLEPTLEEHKEESETDSSKELGAGDDDGELFRQDTQPPSDNNIEIAASKVNDNASSETSTDSPRQAPQSEVRDVFAPSSTKADAAVNVFPTPKVEEYFSEYEYATEDEQVLVADQAHRFKADTAAFEHLESSAANEQDNTDKFRESCNK